MADTISKEHRSWNMSRIKGKDTKPEVRVRSWLFRHGYRFRKNDKRLPGVPDVVLPKYKSVIFVNGCFWHRHEGCKYAYTPKSRVDFWQKKFDQNVVNDKLHRDQLEQMGWKVITIWECELKDRPEEVMENVSRALIKNLKI
jgi:DNA mismatch endonuclease (patch repair protein)